MRTSSIPTSTTPVLVLVWLSCAAGLVAQTAPEFGSIQRLTNREVQVELSVPAGSYYRLEITTNLLDWSSLVTLLSTGLNRHADSAAPYWLSRYYRGVQLSGTGIVTGDHLVTTNGDVIVHPIDHASFVMSWNSRMIYVDPVGGTTPYQGLPRADLILLTHGHSDHFSATTLDAVRGAGVVIVAPQGVYNSMSTTLKGLTTVLANGSSTTVLGLGIEAVPAYNLVAPNHPRGVGNGYVVTAGGRRIYISGDTEDIPEMRALSGIDLAVVSMNTPYTMTVDQAVSAVRAFRPKVVYPYHYRNADQSYADVEGFKRRVGSDLGIEVRLRKWY